MTSLQSGIHNRPATDPRRTRGAQSETERSSGRRTKLHQATPDALRRCLGWPTRGMAALFSLIVGGMPALGALRSPPLEPMVRTSLDNPSVRFTVPEKPYVVLRGGPLEAVVVDNREVNDTVLPGHRAGYHGMASLKHERQSRNLFVPAFSGLNFEHIHDGTIQPRDVLFEPRRASMQLRVIDEHTVELYQAPTPHWGLESSMRYELLADGVIELTFECIPRRHVATNGYLGLFWASYIDRPESLDIHFRGRPESAPVESAAEWIRGSTPKHGTLATHRGAGDTREFRHDAGFPLELPFGFSEHRFVEPWYFGVCRGMSFAQVFRASDQIRLTQSPSGGGTGCPAWDFQWFIPDYQIGRRYQLVMRVRYAPFDTSGSGTQAADEIRAVVNRWFQ